jgi:sentrin-specific protease 7
VGHETDQTPTAMDRSQQTVLSSPLQNSRLKHKGFAGLPQKLNEFNDVERTIRMSPGSRRFQIRQFSFDSPDEKFTEKAAQQRRNLMSAAGDQSSQVNGKPKGAGDALVMDRIEIGTKKADKNRVAIPSNPTRPPVNGRESPDELQGAITTHPMSKTSTEKPVKAGRQCRIETHPLPTRKRSPSDIQPTEFSSPQDKKKAKRSHQKPAKVSILQTSYFRMGSFSKSCTKDESAPIYVIDNGIQLCEDIPGPGPDSMPRIPFGEIRNILVGDGTSRKVRLSMARPYSDSNKILDIEFWTPEEKDTLLNIPGLPNIGQELRDAYDFQMTSLCSITMC